MQAAARSRVSAPEPVKLSVPPAIGPAVAALLWGCLAPFFPGVLWFSSPSRLASDPSLQEHAAVADHPTDQVDQTTPRLWSSRQLSPAPRPWVCLGWNRKD